MTLVEAGESLTQQDIERITRKYAGRVRSANREDVEATVRAEFDRWSTVAVREFVSIFVERSVRSHYGLLGTAGDN
jgi:hypothetical protein